jgi:PIN domain nuclease of toxin-antitoxin system
MNALLARVRALLLDADTTLTVSVVSAWEIALKPELGIDDVTRWLRCRQPSPRAHPAGPPRAHRRA